MPSSSSATINNLVLIGKAVRMYTQSADNEIDTII